VNHPSVVMWDNGNEGGWNTAYDQDFREMDIQQREVNHPWAVHKKTNTAHYISYDYLAMDHFAPRKIFFPTELLHGLYDGGLAAGLEDYWLRMWEQPLNAGGFLWVFADEAIKRSDTGQLDSDGNHAPDGIVGPYHEKEGSFFAIREIWSPVHFEKRYITPKFNGEFRIQNRFHYTNLDQCTFSYQWQNLPGPAETGKGKELDRGKPEVDPLVPGQNGLLRVPLPEGWSGTDVLFVEAFDPCYYSKLYWAVISDKNERSFTVYSRNEDIFLRLFTPEEAPVLAKTTMEHPSGDISFMNGIPAIGTKFATADQNGPHSRPYSYMKRRVEGGALKIELTFDFK